MMRSNSAGASGGSKSAATPEPAASGRRVGFGVAAFYVALFVAMVWPVYPWFATVEPRVLTMPFSLFYVVLGLLFSFFVLLAYYRWERNR